jgi:kynurenine formamidase/GNAT superfamily N-acetyltransferase
MENLIVELTPYESEQACRDISANLPEWFGIPEANERYALGVKERLTFGYIIDKICLGMISLEFPFKNTANIYWMGVRRDSHNKGIGKALLRHAEIVCLERQVYSLSVETLSPKENDNHYLNTFKFYTKEGFKPLFELNTYGPEYLMVYLNKIISPRTFEWIDLTHEISEDIPTWSGDCGFKHTNIVKYEDCTTECKFLVQHLEMLAGIGTHIDAPSHCFPSGKTVKDLSLQTLISPCVVIDVSKEAYENYSTEIETIRIFEKNYGKIWKNTFVIFYTDWGRFWNQAEKYRNNYNFPSISREVAEYLVSEDIVGIGIDTLSPDRPESGYPVHQLILGAGKYIVENIANAGLLPITGSHVFVMPLQVSKGTEAPIRLLGMLQKPYKFFK